MEQYISKSALVAGIKKLHGNPFYRMAIKDVLSILDTMQEEPVSDDLEEAAEAWSYNDDNTGSCDYIGVTVCEYAFKAGAKWQKKQMMMDAIDVTVHIDAGGYPYIPQIEFYDYDKDVPLAKKGDKYKVVLIKEE